MAFYRGAGGAGDAVNDAASEALITIQAKDAAIAAQVAAEAAQDAAEIAEGNAETSATYAQNASDSAYYSATQANAYASSSEASAIAAASSASQAAISATNASSSASSANSSASSANSSKNAAATSALQAEARAFEALDARNAASGYATAASASATAAANSAAAAASSLDNFDDRYLGAKATEPTTDNDGNALVTGALYFNTVSETMLVWDGSAWITATAASQNSVKTFEYVATAGQTTFSGADVNAEILAYTEGLIEVQINGLVLRPGDDYTATNGTSVVLSSAAAVGDEIQIDAYDSFVMADSENPTFTGVATFPAIIENASIQASAATGTINFNAKTNSVLYYTSNATANFTLNIRGNDITTLDATIPTGKVMTVVFLNTNGGTPYYASTIQIDGTTVTPKWQGATAPSAGNTGIDIYTFAIIKTASNTYTVLGSMTQFN